MGKIGIIGTGHVGTHCAYTLLAKGVCNEIILYDINCNKLESETADLQDSTANFPHRVTVSKGDYNKIAECDIIVICVGLIKHERNDRLTEFPISIAMIEDVIPKAVRAGFNGIFISITNPCDVIAYKVRELSGFTSNKVFGTGTALDTARLKSMIAIETGFAEKSIDAYVLGEHGNSMFVSWSNVRIGGIPIDILIENNASHFKTFNKEIISDRVKKQGSKVYSAKGATEYGIASTLVNIADSVLRNEKAIYPVSVLLNGQYGEKGIYNSSPCVIGRNGAEEILELPLNEAELALYKHSAKIIRDNNSR